MIHRSFPSGNIDRIVLNIHSVKHSVFDWLDRCSLTRLTSELGEEASRNACYSKQLCDSLFSGRWIIPVKSWHMLWESYPLMQQKQPSPALARPSLLPSSCPLDVWLWLDFMFWYQQARLGPAVQIGQSVPSLYPSRSGPSKQNQEVEECTSGGFYCNYSRFGLELYSSKWKHENSCCVTQFHNVQTISEHSS